MNYEVAITSESKKCFFVNKETKETGVMRHASSFISIQYRGKTEIVFKITKKLNHYDSRTGNKAVDAREVKQELCRMLGYENGIVTYHKALQAMQSAEVLG